MLIKCLNARHDGSVREQLQLAERLREAAIAMRPHQAKSGLETDGTNDKD